MKKICAYGALLGAALMLMPGCFGGETKEVATTKADRPASAAKEKKGTPVITIDDVVTITDSELDEYVDMYIQAQSQQMPGFDFKAMLAQLPADQKRLFYEGIIKMLEEASLIQVDVVAQGLHKSAEYQKNLQKLYEELERNLAQIEFQKRLAADIKPVEKDVEAFYVAERASNPYMQRAPFIVKAGGSEAVVVKAKDEAQAKSLVESAKVRGLEKAASEVGAKADKSVVTMQTTKLDQSLVSKILSATKFPMIEAVKVGDAWYVIDVKGQIASEYAPFAKVKKEAEELYMNSLFGQRYQDEIGKIKAKHKVEVNAKVIDKLVK